MYNYYCSWQASNTLICSVAITRKNATRQGSIAILFFLGKPKHQVFQAVPAWPVFPATPASPGSTFQQV